MQTFNFWTPRFLDEVKMAMRGRDLREWRKRNGFSQEQLRLELKLASRQTLNSWEHLEREVPPLVEPALCKLEPDQIFGQRAE